MEAVGERGGLNLDVTLAVAEGGTYTEFEDGDVIVAKITPCIENGKGALATALFNRAAYGTTELTFYACCQTWSVDFLLSNISDIYRKLGEAEMQGAAGQKRVPANFTKNFYTPLPPIFEQRAIADWLDTATAEIDTLLAKKRALIEKLHEKRSALISRVVTRGLPPDAASAAGLNPFPQLKQSGVNWIGEIPTHWGVASVYVMPRKPHSNGEHPTNGAE